MLLDIIIITHNFLVFERTMKLFLENKIPIIYELNDLNYMYIVLNLLKLNLGLGNTLPFFAIMATDLTWWNHTECELPWNTVLQ